MDVGRFWGVFILCALLGAVRGNASYIVTPLPVLLESADLIVVGTILQVDKSSLTITASKVIIPETSFTFSVQDVLKGKVNTKVIRVEKFQDWLCAHRYSEYEPGQQAMLFLETAKGKRKYSWRIIGAGNEGEWELFDGEFIDRTWTGKDIFGPGIQGKIQGIKFYWRRWRGANWAELDRIISDRYEQNATIQALKDYGRCFWSDSSVSRSKRYSQEKEKVSCSEAELQDYQGRSRAHHHIFKRFLPKK